MLQYRIDLPSSIWRMLINNSTYFISKFFKEPFICDCKKVIKQFLDDALDILLGCDNIN